MKRTAGGESSLQLAPDRRGGKLSNEKCLALREAVPYSQTVLYLVM